MSRPNKRKPHAANIDSFCFQIKAFLVQVSVVLEMHLCGFWSSIWRMRMVCWNISGKRTGYRVRWTALAGANFCQWRATLLCPNADLFINERHSQSPSSVGSNQQRDLDDGEYDCKGKGVTDLKPALIRWGPKQYRNENTLHSIYDTSFYSTKTCLKCKPCAMRDLFFYWLRSLVCAHTICSGHCLLMIE